MGAPAGARWLLPLLPCQAWAPLPGWHTRAPSRAWLPRGGGAATLLSPLLWHSPHTVANGEALWEGWATGAPFPLAGGAPGAGCGAWASHCAVAQQLSGPSSSGGERHQCPDSSPVLSEQGALGLCRCQQLCDEDQDGLPTGGRGRVALSPMLFPYFLLLLLRLALGLRVLLMARHGCKHPGCGGCATALGPCWPL